jgi:predicted polyphosphate/ATP-dependent NAD kinase
VIVSLGVKVKRRKQAQRALVRLLAEMEHDDPEAVVVIREFMSASGAEAAAFRARVRELGGGDQP